MGKEIINLGKNIEKYRKRNNITIKELSKMSGINEKYLYKIETAQAVGVKLSHAERIANCLNINLLLLFKE